MHFIKTIVKLISPLLLFVILVIPYGWLNSNLLVDIFGCGCPTVDEFGNIIHPDFNTNKSSNTQNILVILK